MGWELAAGLNLAIASAYVAIAWLIFLGLKRTQQLRSNPLGFATGTIFLTCATHHAHHAIHILGLIGHHSAYDQNIIRTGMGGWHSVAIDAVGAVVAFSYLGLRHSYVALLNTPTMFEDAVRVEAQNRLERLAFTDQLTGCANRAAYQVHIDDLSGTGVPVAIVFLDVDGFKEVNDTYGHEAGDRLLTLLANRLGIHIKANERVFRLGGDEFVVVQSGPDGSGAEDLLLRCHNLIQEPMTMREGSLQLRASMGCAAGFADHKLDQLLREADQAMYSVKKSPTRPTNPVLFPLPSQRDPENELAFRHRANPALYG